MWKSMPLPMKGAVILFVSLFALFALAIVLAIIEDIRNTNTINKASAHGDYDAWNAQSKVAQDSIDRAQDSIANAKWQEGHIPASIYIVVEHALKKVAHDPSSIEAEIDGCVITGGDPETGWLVECIVRGKNAFGAQIRTTQTARIHRIAGRLYATIEQ